MSATARDNKVILACDVRIFKSIGVVDSRISRDGFLNAGRMLRVGKTIPWSVSPGKTENLIELFDVDDPSEFPDHIPFLVFERDLKTVSGDLNETLQVLLARFKEVAPKIPCGRCHGSMSVPIGNCEEADPGEYATKCDLCKDGTTGKRSAGDEKLIEILESLLKTATQ